MKRTALIPALAALALGLAGCTPALSTQDRMTLTEAHQQAQQALITAQAAKDTADKAEADAQKAAADAAAANEKAHRMFRASQNK